ncbi:MULTISPECIES: mechanosensitive ion channel family protein [Priestia]|uniref:Mechanosensitive ion channel protein MscS n=1 Tax=Priestia filamentosa TaxID=1402861 RepID=A0A1X7G6Q2_9BACI|nr:MULTISPECIES: mechanosensitive ion channel family protein [Priestia]AKO94893.1 mechanosensitive ion channel protein MscS [Priestia filamentosa]MCY8231205.1 mechanosensitive ion channel family protein [Priestia endophytica]MDT3765238.1 mechanosensitive ion channel family protein [Priestia filamentosa]MED3728037.1 mechanosensitive ion channel family protein [Priestia filamentosa]OXS65632.1 mechanosensitive ion channel protein MscS [Priestia filamentosa]
MNATEKAIDKIVGYLSNEDLWILIGEKCLKIILILVLSFLFIRVGKALLNKSFEVRMKSPLRISERREATISRLLQNTLTYFTYFVAIVMILETLSLEVRALLAGAGVVGLAIGFGAQNLVRDIITGFFIIFEDQFSVGDYVRITNFEGTVEEIGIRTTKIKSWTGELHIFPNGNITDVTNFSIHNSMAVVDVNISYKEDIEKAEKVILELLPQLPARYENMVKEPELLGVQSLGPTEVMIRVACEVKPMTHVPIARKMRKDIKGVLDANGIQVPFAQMMMYNPSNSTKPL